MPDEYMISTGNNKQINTTEISIDIIVFINLFAMELTENGTS